LVTALMTGTSGRDITAFCSTAEGVEEPGSSRRPTVKQQLSAIRTLFDWFVVGHVLPVSRLLCSLQVRS
jgi:hypothetical protein